MITEEIRSYEVSLWTLQDEFITVLKWSDVEQQGRIQDPEMTLNIDGTEKFTFKIPMYLESYINGRRIVIENPNWHNTKNGNLMEGMRKIKVIFNKMTSDKAEFEFLITKITEEHQTDQLFCNVECEGLAFHELGKIGYKINLSIDTFLLDHEEWEKNGYWTKADGTTVTEEPQQSIDYWCEQCLLTPWRNNIILNPKKWYYKINMNWSAFKEIENRSAEKLYEEEYTTSWDNNLNPIKVASAREKFRPIEVSESNIYNITQTIAETFGIHCRYEYQHDANNHIIGRIVVFYNNYFAEEKGTISLTYPYTSKSISREIDSSNITTKMFVTSQEDNSTLNGMITIMDSPANMMQEDYLLDFEYMYKCGAITQEQYDEVFEYQKYMRNTNQALVNYSLLLNGYENQKIDLEAQIQVLDKSIEIAQEQIDDYSALYNRIDSSDGDADGYFQRKADSNYRALAITDKLSGLYYIDFNEQDKGILESSLALYKTYSGSATTEEEKLTNQISNVTYAYDKYGDIIRAYFPANTFGVSESHMVYAVYKYSPKLYYEEIIQDWIKKKDADVKDLQDLKDDLDDVLQGIEDTKTSYENKCIEKQKRIHVFEEMMGPALREGYWSPEEYSDYGDQKAQSKSFPNTYTANAIKADAEEGIIVNWDNELFSGEQNIYYEEGIKRDKHYYPCIDISGANNSSINLTNIKEMMNDTNGKLSFVFNNNYFKDLANGEESLLQNFSNFTLGGKMHFGFIHIGSTIKPVLILDGVKSMTDDEIKFMLTTGTGKGNPKLCVFDATVEEVEGEDTIHITTTSSISVPLNKIYWVPSLLSGVQDITSAEVIYPRVKFSDQRLKTNSNYLSIAYGSSSNILTAYEDYSMVPRVTIRDNCAISEYFLTIKPEVFINALTYTGAIYANYVLSNAATSIYLDAKEILKENSEPKVSYEVEINVLNEEYMRILYSMLAQLVIINDVDLKFENEYGYISEVNLKLDKPWEDTIEVKNYKTKFEDLFSTIVAQTEEMKKNSAYYAAAAGGSVPLQSEALEVTINNNPTILGTFIDDYFNNSDSIEARLKSLFNEAGELLAHANSTLNNVQELSRNNQSILSGFATTVNTELTPYVFNSVDQPKIFKVGDIWNKLDSDNKIDVIARYVATASSEDANGGGWTQVYDGILAQIKGAGLNIDAVKGLVEIEAENIIDIKSGNNIDIRADANVNIHGNQAVNIGGTTINIGSEAEGNNEGGINLVATTYNTVPFASASESKVLINPHKITMAGSTIELYTGNNGTTSAIKIDGTVDANSPTPGIWVGSNKSVELYSGTGSTGSNISLTPSHIIMGTVGDNSTAFEMTQDYLIMAAGNPSSNFSNSVVSEATNSLAGLRLTKSSFGLSIGSGLTRSVFLMNNNGFIIGAGTDANGTIGSTVTITGKKIDISTGGDFIVNANSGKFKLASDATTTTPNLYVASSNTWSNADSGIQYTATNGLEIKGTITANTLYIYDPTQPAGSQYPEATNWVSAKVTPAAIWLGVKKATDPNDSDHTNAASYLSITDNQIKIKSGGIFSIDASNIFIKTDAGANDTIFKVSDGATTNPTNYFRIYKDNGTVKAQLGGWLLTDHRLYNGTTGNNSTNYVALNSDTSIAYAMWAGKESPDDVLTGATKTIEGITYNVVDSNNRGAPFRVTRNGQVYMDKLMLWDSTNNVYKEVDFSDFNQAVSLSLTCSGTTISAQANYWGKFNRSLPKTASASLTNITAGGAGTAWGVGSTKVTINTDVGNLEFNNVSVNATAIAENAHNNVKNAVMRANLYPGENQFYTIASIDGYQNVSVTLSNPYTITVTTDIHQSTNTIVGDATAWVNGQEVANSDTTTFEITAELTVDDNEDGTYSLRAGALIDGTEVDHDTDTIIVDNTTAYNAGWNACRTQMINNRTPVTYYQQGAEFSYYTSNDGVFVSGGPYTRRVQGQEATVWVYTLPNEI